MHFHKYGRIKSLRDCRAVEKHVSDKSRKILRSWLVADGAFMCVLRLCNKCAIWKSGLGLRLRTFLSAWTAEDIISIWWEQYCASPQQREKQKCIYFSGFIVWLICVSAWLFNVTSLVSQVRPCFLTSITAVMLIFWTLEHEYALVRSISVRRVFSDFQNLSNLLIFGLLSYQNDVTSWTVMSLKNWLLFKGNCKKYNQPDYQLFSMK